MQIRWRLAVALALVPCTLVMAAAANADPAATDPPVLAETPSSALSPAETPSSAEAPSNPQALAPAPVPQPYRTGATGLAGYFANWFARVDHTQSEQPHWMTPLVTVTPRLEEEVRYDQYWEHSRNDSNLDVFDAGKGLELIPDETNEVLINMPPYQRRDAAHSYAGWADWPFLTVKQRLLSANEQNGNYILTAFLGFQAPTGITAFTNNAWIITPTIAGGKGWGDFDVQSTLGFPVPTNHESTIGTSLVWNTAFQYHIAPVIWPEIEFNLTHWFDGVRGGHTQVFMTPGVIFGRFPLFGSRFRLILGAGYQTALGPSQIYTPALTPLYSHAWIVTGRVAF